MKTRPNSGIISCFISCTLSFCLLIPLLGISQWQATMVNSMQKEEFFYTVHSDLNHYRYDFTIDGAEGAVIVDPEEGQTAILMLKDKMVHYTDTDGSMSRQNDPVQGYNAYVSYGEEKVEGKEEMEGYECVKKSIYQEDEKLYTQWFSEELNFPVRIEAYYGDGQFMKLKDIADWDVDPSLFVVTDDFVEVDQRLRPVIPEPEPPSEWETVDASVPVDMEIERGMEISFPITKTVYHEMVINNTGDTPLKFVFHQYENGEEQTDDKQGPNDFRTKRLYMGEKYNMTFNWEEGWTIKVNVHEGKGKLMVNQE